MGTLFMCALRPTSLQSAGHLLFAVLILSSGTAGLIYPLNVIPESIVWLQWISFWRYGSHAILVGLFGRDIYKCDEFTTYVSSCRDGGVEAFVKGNSLISELYFDGNDIS